MSKRRLPLRQVNQQLPVSLNTCDMPWEEMPGGERRRMCEHCDRSVTNLSDMSREEAERFLTDSDYSECVSYELMAGEIVHHKEGPRQRWKRPPHRCSHVSGADARHGRRGCWLQ